MGIFTFTYIQLGFGDGHILTSVSAFTDEADIENFSKSKKKTSKLQYLSFAEIRHKKSIAVWSLASFLESCPRLVATILIVDGGGKEHLEQTQKVVTSTILLNCTFTRYQKHHLHLHYHYRTTTITTMTTTTTTTTIRK